MTQRAIMTNEYTQIYHQKKVWYKVVAALAAVVVFCTVYALILPALTETHKVYCGYEEAHSDACYETERVLTCQQEESEGHQHSDACYETQRVLVCQQEESEAHQHSDACYEMQRVLVCQQEESEGHTHNDACYTEQKHLICQKPLHQHTKQCFSDPEADVECQSTWDRMMADVELTGVWSEDVLSVAKSQLGYRESERNYRVLADGITENGYTRYGDWYGSPYGDWCAMFCAFCLDYAGVTDYPTDANCGSWITALSADENDSDRTVYYHEAGSYEPKSGDLIFFDWDAEEAGEDAERVDHVGFVAEVIEATKNTPAQVKTIEGNNGDKVAYHTYDLDSKQILGYGQLPENPNQVKSARLTASPMRAALAASPIPTLPTTSANSWQIVSQGYTGNDVAQKIPVDGDGDGQPDVYIQKNVVPTSKEDEFLVYLSIDKRLSIEEFLDQSKIGLTNSNKYASEASYPTGKFINESMAGNPTYLYPVGQTGGYSNKYWVHFYIYEKQSYAPTFDKNGNVVNKASGPVLYEYWSERYGQTPNASNGTGFLEFAGHSGFLVVARTITLKGDGAGGHGNPLAFHIGADKVFELGSLYKEVLENVVDEMGENIIFDGLVGGDYDNNTYFDEAANTLHWTPVETKGTSEYSFTPLDGWGHNVAQLVYKVKLNTAPNDFDSCASNMKSVVGQPESYRVNKNATLNFSKELIDGVNENATTPPLATTIPDLQATFPVPYVRGLNYNIDIVKKSDSGQVLGNAEFALYQQDGVTPVLDKDGKPYVLTTDANGKLKFVDQPCGTYVLRETRAPFGYSVSSSSPWTVKVCYTDNSGVTKDTADPTNMRYIGNGNTWSITNSKAPAQTIQLIKVDKNNTATVLDGAKFDLYGADADGNIAATPLPGYTDLTSGTNGIFSPANFTMPYGTYYLVETQAPIGYEPLAGPVKLMVSASGVTANVNGNALTVTQSGSTYAIYVTNQKLAANLTITKQVVGANSTESFPMTATLDTGTFTIPAGVIGCTLSSDGKTVNFTLAHGESVRLEVPIGATVTLTETSHDGYYSKIIQGGVSIGEGDTADILILRDTDVTVQNSAGYELPKTGGAGTTLFTLGGLLLMAGAMMYGCAIRRRREGRGD